MCALRILFDHGVPRGLRGFLAGHDVTETRAMGWERLGNGDLLKTAEEAGFELFVTMDQNLRYQQNLAGRVIAILALTGSSKWLRVKAEGERIGAVVDGMERGGYVEVFIPFR